MSVAMNLTDAAEDYDPTGDSDHIAYGADFVWRCSCGRTSGTSTIEPRARHRAEAHEEYCMKRGDVTLDVIA